MTAFPSSSTPPSTGNTEVRSTARPCLTDYLHRAASRVPYFSSDGETYLAQTPLRDLKKTVPLRVLSEEDFAFWQTYGYVVVKQAIPASAARSLLDFAWDFQGLDPDRPDTWYEEREFRSDLDRDLHIYGFVEAYHHQLLWDSRQAQRVYDAFVDVWDCEELWVTLDRLNLNPPNVKNRDRALIRAHGRGLRHRAALGRRHHARHAAAAGPGDHRAQRHQAGTRRLPVLPRTVPAVRPVEGTPAGRP